MESHDVVKNLLKIIPAKHVAQELGVSLSLVYKWAEAPITGSGASNPLDRIEVITRLTQDMAPLEWLCSRFDGSFVKRPNTQVAPEDFVFRVSRVMIELGNLLSAFSSASTSPSGKFPPAKIREIRMRWERAKSTIEMFMAAAEQGHYSLPPPGKTASPAQLPGTKKPASKISPTLYKRSLRIPPS